MKICVTGGAGFIGANFVKFLRDKYSDLDITVIDKLTYASNIENLDGLDVRLVEEDICDLKPIHFDSFDVVYHFAAESHVDRSILYPQLFLRSNVLGTVNLLSLCKTIGVGRFVYISTDEVYGSVDRSSREADILDPSSAYSASKVAAECFCNAYHKTFDIPIVVTRSSNNFGPYQHLEKLIPIVITNAISDNKIPIHGTGGYIRDWIYVMDNCEGIEFVGRNGILGEAYNIGGGNQLTNLEITDKILNILGKPMTLVEFVTDRPGQDNEYNLDCWKVAKLGWKPKYDFDQALEITVGWYKKQWKR